MDGAAIGGEIGGVLVGVPEEPEQIVGELGRHIVDVNLDRHAQRIVRVTVQPPALGRRNQIVKLLLTGDRTDGMIWRRRMMKKMLERSDEGGLGVVSGGHKGAGMVWELGGIAEGEEEEDERENGEREEEEKERRFGSGSGRAVLSCQCHSLFAVCLQFHFSCERILSISLLVSVFYLL